jgi:hypothetical protein
VILLLVLLQWARVSLDSLVIALVLMLAFLPPAVSMIRTLRQSERRNEMLSDLAKFQEHLRETPEATRDAP